jgi:hypothetical protein
MRYVVILRVFRRCFDNSQSCLMKNGLIAMVVDKTTSNVSILRSDTSNSNDSVGW